jgi:hypothetical protein
MTSDYLLTIETRNGCSVHAYLMTDDRRYVDSTINLMTDEAERRGLHVIPIVLSTTLREDGRSEVRGMVARMAPEAAEALTSATEFHQSIWIMSKDHPDNEQLMALH